MGDVNKTLVTNFYDNATATGSVSNPCYRGYAAPTVSGATFLMDSSIPDTYTYRGLATGSTTPAGSTCSAYYDTGNLQTASDTSGNTITITTSSSTNYTAPQSITTQSYSETIGYNSWLGITQTTGANGEQLSMTYDSSGRPTTGTSPYGDVTYYGYSSSGVPVWQTKTGPDGFTKTTLDGLGRSVLVERGTASNNLLSATQTVYAPCACSPLAKIQKVSQPYQDVGSPSAWTVYTYDGLGRTLSTTQPEGASATTYSYQGNQTTVMDPAGKWKTFTTDVLGNLVMSRKPGTVGRSFWLTVVFLVAGWGPVFIADLVCANAGSQLDASYMLQHYALLWMPITELCTLQAAVVCMAAVVRHFIGWGRTSQGDQ